MPERRISFAGDTLPGFRWVFARWSRLQLAKYEIAGITIGSCAVLAMVRVGQQLHVSLVSVVFLLLGAVVFVAFAFGITVAAVVALVSTFSINYFLFHYSLQSILIRPQSWVMFGTLGCSALLVDRLLAQTRAQKELANEERIEQERLHAVSRQMLLLDRQRTAGAQILQMIERIFETDAAVLFDATSGEVNILGNATTELLESTKAAFFQERDWFESWDGTWYRVLRLGAKPVGALALRGATINTAVANVLASLSALGIERVRSFEAESRALAARHTEQLRTVVLDAFAHEFKTPLTTIRAASAGLLNKDALPVHQHDLLQLIDEQSARLTDLTTHLLRMAKLEASELRLNRKYFPVGDVVQAITSNMASRLAGHSLVLAIPDESLPVYVDAELMILAMTQIVDNASKYSPPNSVITISAIQGDADTRISVHNTGSRIADADRERVFERFYRSPGSAHRAAGTGLGLSITKKIVEAHQGRVWVESEDEGTTFFVSLPLRT